MSSHRHSGRTRLTRLADDYDGLVARPARHPGALTARIPVDQLAVDLAAGELRAVATRLRAQPPPPEDGVDAARRLLTDGTGPLYRAADDAALRRAAQEVLGRLGPG